VTAPAGTAIGDFPQGGGAMGARIRAHDWARTPLGPIAAWPRSLRTAVQIMLTSRFAMWMAWGPELVFFCNDAYRPTLGVKDPWALGSPAATVWAEIWPEIGPRIGHVMDTGEATWDEGLMLFLERSGYPEETYHTFSYSPVPGDDGHTAGMLCVVTEETERMIGERRLAQLRDLAAAITSAQSQDEVLRAVEQGIGVSRKDLPFTLLYLLDEGSGRARLAAATGFDPGHAAAPAAIELDAAGPAWPLAAALAGDGLAVADGLDTRFADLPRGPWDLPPNQAAILRLARQGHEEAAGFLITGINPFRRMGPSYAGYLRLLAGQVSAGLANARAYEEERRRVAALAEIDKAKTAFFSNVSHEFRTPLTLTLGTIEEVLEKAGRTLPADTAALLDTAHRNGLRLLKLVNMLLDFSRIEAGRAQTSFVPTDLSEVTRDLASNFRAAMDRAGLRYTIDCAPLPHPVHVDRDMWEKIVLNLLSNAFKFTLAGEVAVTLKAAASGDAAILTVRDSGIGIPAEELPHLFERFHRVEGARGRSFEGSGIGLALVQELVRLHGGAIVVESTPGEGTTFTLRLPFGTAHLPAQREPRVAPSWPAAGMRAQAFVEEALRWLPTEDAARPEEDAPAAEDHGELPPRTAPAAAGARILLADDNADMRDYVRRLLEAEGHRVEAVADGAAALEAARRHPPDLILSDVMMPQLDGFGLVAALRADPVLRESCIVLLSARAGEEARVEGMAAGADDYLTKPFAARELLARVASNVQLARVRRDGRELLREETYILETLNRVGETVAAELALDRAVQVVTDAATALSGAAFGAFFYNVLDAQGASYMLYTLSGVDRAAFAQFPMPRATAVFGPTFRGEGMVRSDDITADPRYGRNAPHTGMPAGHLPVRSYLAAPVVGRAGEVLGGLFFGHPEPGRFTERSERLVEGIARQAAIAIDNARLFEAAQAEIAERKRTEAALREAEERQLRLNESLEAMVAERTAELSAANQRLRDEAEERSRVEEALRQAQKMETIGQLTGGVAHDFNNLLTIIIGNLETLQRQMERPGAEPARLKRAADNAFRGAQRAASLTQRLLAFSRRQPLDPKPVDVNRLVAAMSDLLRRTLGESIAIETVLAGGLWRTHVDPNQLENALLNLALNARDAMPEGGKLTIETANTHLDEVYAARQAEVIPGQYVVICITDTGAGMSRAVLAQAFEPFFTTKDVGHGTGLGLSQVYGFVKQSGGHVKLYSEVGEGTTVKVYMPRLMAEDEAAEAEEPPAAMAAAPGTRTILIVEDDDDVRAHSIDVLSELGYRVLDAPNGAAALDILDRNPDISLLFTDVGLPGGMNGRQLAEEARRRRPKLSVLFTTGYAKNAIVHDGRLDPGVQLITKPFTYAALASKIRDIVEDDGEPPCILIVEDEALVRMVIVDTLETLGFRVEEAGSATEAINKVKARDGRIAAAIVDVGLPDRKGDALAGELRAMHADLPIVIASGYGEGALKDRFGGDPRIGFLGKPYQNEQLEAALRGLGVEIPTPG